MNAELACDATMRKVYDNFEGYENIKEAARNRRGQDPGLKFADLEAIEDRYQNLGNVVRNFKRDFAELSIATKEAARKDLNIFNLSVIPEETKPQVRGLIAWKWMDTWMTVIAGTHDGASVEMYQRGKFVKENKARLFNEIAKDYIWSL